MTKNCDDIVIWQEGVIAGTEMCAFTTASGRPWQWSHEVLLLIALFLIDALCRKWNMATQDEATRVEMFSPVGGGDPLQMEYFYNFLEMCRSSLGSCKGGKA